MPFLGRNYGSNGSSSSGSKSTFAMQKLLYEQAPPSGLPSYCAVTNDRSNALPTSTVIEQFCSSIITAFSTLSFPENSEDDAKWSTLCAKFGSFALFIDRKLSSLVQDCRLVEERYPSTSNEELVREVFRVLAEVLFLACE